MCASERSAQDQKLPRIRRAVQVEQRNVNADIKNTLDQPAMRWGIFDIQTRL